MFVRDCVVRDKFELRYKNKDRHESQEYPLLLILDGPAKAIVKMLEKKEKYKDLREKTILVTDLISAEFKYHDKCRKKLARDDRDTSIVERLADGFKKVTDYVHNYVLKMNQVVSMNICYGAVNSEVRKDTIAKRKQRLKYTIHDYYGEVVIIMVESFRDSY